jgi:hypothetical protein
MLVVVVAVLQFKVLLSELVVRVVVVLEVLLQTV